MKRLATMSIIVTAVVFVAGLNAQTYYGSAFKDPVTTFNLQGIPADHTYYCLNGTTDCHAVASSGVQSSATGGTRLWETYGPNTASERCASRARASNSAISKCGFTYMITGVCHQHANRGIASFGKVINKDNIRGGWLSYQLYGAQGFGWNDCRIYSNRACGRADSDR